MTTVPKPKNRRKRDDQLGSTVRRAHDTVQHQVTAAKAPAPKKQDKAQQKKTKRGVDKPGWQTTEFWAATMTAGVTVLNASDALPEKIPTQNILGMITMAVIYAIARTIAKVVAARRGP